MPNKTSTLIPAKLSVFTWFVLSLCVVYKPAFAQEYTVKDSASFQKALGGNLSDFDRIDYQLKLAEFSIRKAGSFKSDLDIARTWINKSEKLNEHLKSKEAEGHILFEESYLEMEYGISPKGKALMLSAISLLKNGNDKCLLATAYKALSYYYNLDNPNEVKIRIDLIKHSVTLFKQCDNNVKTAATLQYLAEMYLEAGDFAMVPKTINESLAIYNSIHYKHLQGLYNLMAEVYYVQTDYNNCIKYELLALKTTEQLRDSSMQACEINNHLGLVMIYLGQISPAIPYLKAALIIAKKHNDVNSILTISINLASSYIKLNTPKEALNILDVNTEAYGDAKQDISLNLSLNDSYLIVCSKLRLLDRAPIYAEKILETINSHTLNKFDLTNSYHALISYYFATKNYNKELIYVVKNQKITENAGIPANKAMNLGFWYQLDSAKKDYKNAFFHLLKYKALSDSIFNEKKSQQISQLEVQDKTQQKDDEIKFEKQNIKILTQDAKLNRVKLKGAKFTRNVTLAGGAVFILIIAMQYRRYQEKQKVNLLITDKNAALQKLVTEKEWLLKEVHHRVKNNLHTVICLLESQAAYLENDALKAVENSQHRIFAMSLIHQKLYQSPDIQTIDMAVYLPEFILYLKESFGTPFNIVFQQEIESIRLDVSQAVPIALIVNEAVTNAIKYAFPGGMAGAIRIALLHQQASIALSIEDNGIGIPASVKPDELNSLGLELIRGLTDDLKGNVRFIVKNGTSVNVAFEKAPINGM